jgi:hypothetical protein
MPRGPNPLRTKLKENEFYCVGCRARVKVDPEDIRFKDYSSSKRMKIPMIKGQCGSCNANVNKIVANSVAGNMRRKYGK